MTTTREIFEELCRTREFDRNTIVVACMDVCDHSGFRGECVVRNSGPRWADSERSVRHFLALRGMANIRLLWVTHTGPCSGTRLELETGGSGEHDEATRRRRREELIRVLRDPSVSVGIAHGHLRVLAAELVLNDSTVLDLRPCFEETNQLLAEASLPTLE